MDDVQEQQEVAAEIGEAISNPVGFGHDVDEVWRWFVPLLDCQYKMTACVFIMSACLVQIPV